VRRAWLVAACVYVGLIFFVSSRPYLHAPGPQFDMKDKLAHATEYGVLAWLLMRACGRALTRDRVISAMAVVAVVALIAAGDELFQGTVPGRLTDPADWLADLTGAAIAATLFTLRGVRADRRIAGEQRA